MEEYSQQMFLDLLQRVTHKYHQFEGQKRYYGTDMLLTISEIHTIDAIGKNESINLIGLARIKGITKGTASQMIGKLVEKGLVEKKAAPSSDREIVLSLTEKGWQAFEGHRQMHRDSGSRLNAVVADMDPEQLAVTTGYLGRIEEELDLMLKE